MSPEECISGLDRALAEAGEDVVLRRVIGVAPNTVNIDVPCRAFVTGVTGEQVVAGLAATDVNVVLSPSEIATDQWPGGTPETTLSPTIDPHLPRIGDQVITQDKLRSVVYAQPVYVAAVLVRINLRVAVPSVSRPS